MLKDSEELGRVDDMVIKQTNSRPEQLTKKLKTNIVGGVPQLFTCKSALDLVSGGSGSDRPQRRCVYVCD